MKPRRFLIDVLVGLIVAAIGSIGILTYLAHPGCGEAMPCHPPGTALVVIVTRDLNTGDVIQNGDWATVDAYLPSDVARLYFAPQQVPLFIGKTLVRPLHVGELLSRDDVGDSGGPYAVVPITFRAAPGSLKSSDSVCIYYLDGTTLRIFYLTPLVITASSTGWEVRVPPIKAPYFLYAAAYGSLVASSVASSGLCPATPIFNMQQLNAPLADTSPLP
jgi:hypothetical protein